MKEFFDKHFFWKWAFKGKNAIFNIPVKTSYKKIETILSVLPILFLTVAFFHLFSLQQFTQTPMIDPLWPMLPFKNIEVSYLALFLQVNMIAAFVMWVFKKNSFYIKLYAFVIYFLYVAFANSYGKINHTLYFLLLILFCFLFIPSKQTKNYKPKSIVVFATTQFLLLSAYTMTGVWKLFWGFVQLAKGEVSLFSPLSFRNVLIYQFEVTEPTLLGNWFLEHYYVGWIAYLLVVYIELVSVFIFFKGNLHKIWGVLLILIHLGIALTLDVVMAHAPVALGLLLLMSPFHKDSSIKEILFSLPIVSTISKVFKKSMAR